MEGQRERLDKALRRQGERPTDSKETSELIGAHIDASARWIEKKLCGDTFILDSSIIAPYYPPSTAPLDCLRKLCIKDLQLETHHRGYYLMLKTFMCAYKIAGASISLMRDENENMVPASHHFEDTENVKFGCLIVIKEPYFTIASDGNYYLRVDHVTDIVQLPHQHQLTPLKFRERSLDSELWKQKGNKSMEQQNYQYAAVL